MSESPDSMRLQVQEMARVEEVTTDDEIDHDRPLNVQVSGAVTEFLISRWRSAADASRFDPCGESERSTLGESNDFWGSNRSVNTRAEVVGSGGMSRARRDDLLPGRR
jgi:hypothetical protein